MFATDAGEFGLPEAETPREFHRVGGVFGSVAIRLLGPQVSDYGLKFLWRGGETDELWYFSICEFSHWVVGNHIGIHCRFKESADSSDGVVDRGGCEVLVLL